MGVVIAAGRDAEIVDLGGGRVLRRFRDPRPLQAEVDLMRLVGAAGYPVPAVFEVLPDAMVLERVAGPSMLDDLVAHPWRARAHARTLAALHRRLHDIPAPGHLAARLGQTAPGDVVLHGDLHPGNVLLSPAGPVVIDWSNGGRGPAGADVAEAWLLLAVAGIPGGPLTRAAARLLRPSFLAAFLHHAGRDEAARYLAAVAEVRAADPNLSHAEQAAMARIVQRYGAVGI